MPPLGSALSSASPCYASRNSERVDREPLGVDVGAVDQTRVGDDQAHPAFWRCWRSPPPLSTSTASITSTFVPLVIACSACVLLPRGVLLGVGVDHLAVGAELSTLLEEARPILVLVARGLRLRQKQRDLGRVARRCAARAGPGATTIVVAAAAGAGASSASAPASTTAVPVRMNDMHQASPRLGGQTSRSLSSGRPPRRILRAAGPATVSV